MKKLIICITLTMVTMITSSCVGNSKMDGRIIIDKETDKVYKLEHNFGFNYVLKERFISISGKDTIVDYREIK